MFTFPTGKIVATQALVNTLSPLQISQLLDRYSRCDWGDLCEEDKISNEEALIHQRRILGSYRVNGQGIYIITEADRSITTLMFADEY